MLKIIRQEARDLFTCLRPFQKKSQDFRFAFLVHPRNIEDIKQKYPFLRKIPEWIISLLLKKHWPIVVSDIRGMKDRIDGSPVKGLMISISLTGKQMLENKKYAAKKVAQAVRFAQKLGVKTVGLGAFTSSVTDGGKDFESWPNIAVTSGNTLTATVAWEDLEKILLENRDKIVKIAVIGASGSIGNAIVKSLIQYADFPIREIMLVSKTIEKVKALREEIMPFRKREELVVECSTNISKINDADLVIVATSAGGAIISSGVLKHGTIVYDLTHPRNTSKELPVERKDVRFIEGGLIYAPEISYRFNANLPSGAIFSCLAETMILAAENAKKGYTGHVDPKDMPHVSSLMKLYHFRSYAEF